jgi:hypothetical protein
LIDRGIVVTYKSNEGEDCLMTGCEPQKTYQALLELIRSHGGSIHQTDGSTGRNIFEKHQNNEIK